MEDPSRRLWWLALGIALGIAVGIRSATWWAGPPETSLARLWEPRPDTAPDSDSTWPRRCETRDWVLTIARDGGLELIVAATGEEQSTSALARAARDGRALDCGTHAGRLIVLFSDRLLGDGLDGTAILALGDDPDEPVLRVTPLEGLEPWVPLEARLGSSRALGPRLVLPLMSPIALLPDGLRVTTTALELEIDLDSGEAVSRLHGTAAPWTPPPLRDWVASGDDLVDRDYRLWIDGGPDGAGRVVGESASHGDGVRSIAQASLAAGVEATLWVDPATAEDSDAEADVLRGWMEGHSTLAAADGGKVDPTTWLGFPAAVFRGRSHDDPNRSLRAVATRRQERVYTLVVTGPPDRVDDALERVQRAVGFLPGAVSGRRSNAVLEDVSGPDWDVVRGELRHLASRLRLPLAPGWLLLTPLDDAEADGEIVLREPEAGAEVTVTTAQGPAVTRLEARVQELQEDLDAPEEPLSIATTFLGRPIRLVGARDRGVVDTHLVSLVAVEGRTHLVHARFPDATQDAAIVRVTDLVTRFRSLDAAGADATAARLAETGAALAEFPRGHVITQSNRVVDLDARLVWRRPNTSFWWVSALPPEDGGAEERLLDCTAEAPEGETPLVRLHDAVHGLRVWLDLADAAATAPTPCADAREVATLTRRLPDGRSLRARAVSLRGPLVTHLPAIEATLAGVELSPRLPPDGWTHHAVSGLAVSTDLARCTVTSAESDAVGTIGCRSDALTIVVRLGPVAHPFVSVRALLSDVDVAVSESRALNVSPVEHALDGFRGAALEGVAEGRPAVALALRRGSEALVAVARGPMTLERLSAAIRVVR